MLRDHSLRYSSYLIVLRESAKVSGTTRLTFRVKHAADVALPNRYRPPVEGAARPRPLNDIISDWQSEQKFITYAVTSEVKTEAVEIRLVASELRRLHKDLLKVIKEGHGNLDDVDEYGNTIIHVGSLPDRYLPGFLTISQGNIVPLASTAAV